MISIAMLAMIGAAMHMGTWYWTLLALHIVEILSMYLVRERK